MMQTNAFLFWSGWRAGGLMLIGMALFKWRILSAARSDRFYGWMVAIGLLVGLPVIATGVVQNFAHQRRFEYSFFLGWQFNHWGSLFVAAAYLGLVMLSIRRLPGLRIWERLAAVGRMAFTNYILHSVLCTFIFYGHGLGLYGQVGRAGQQLVVLGVWIVQLAISPWWLARFRFGPLEWLWRSLTYWRLQPLRLPRT